MENKDLNVGAQTNESDVLVGAVITPHTAFKDLLTALGLKSGDKRPCLTPKRINFIMEGRIPTTDYMGCKVYDDGFALYENGLGRYSVIWLPYCISYGLSGKEVAGMLHCAESTVSQHLKAAYRIAQKIIRED